MNAVRTAPKGHALPARAALALSSVVLTLLALECGVRLYSMLWFPRMMELDPHLGWKHTPGVHRVFVNEAGERIEVRQNEYGHRGGAHPLRKDPGKYRILVLGDSFTEGVQVAEGDLFTALLERSDPRYEVLNAGVGGWGTVQEYLYLESDGLRHRPDLVLLMVFGNDLDDNCLAAYPAIGPRPYAVRDGRGVRIVRDPDARAFLAYALPVPFAAVLNAHSYLYYFLNAHVYQEMRARHVADLRNADALRAAECGRYDVLFAMIEKTRRLVASRDARLAVILIPTREQARSGAAAELEPIVDFCARQGIDHLSLLERLRREMDTAHPYFDRDIHWTKDGHRAVAEEIAAFVRRDVALGGRISR
jgi:lysophospholipase L1-like esterase